VKKETKSALDAIKKEHGADSIMLLGDRPAVTVPCISTGSRSLDEALGGHGFPRGRIIEVFGPESSGKTTLCLHAIAEAQKFGRCAIIDAEHALDETWARKLGVDVAELLFCQPSSGEEALQIVSSLVDIPEISMIVVDSVAALVPQKELDGDIGDAHVGLQARLMSQAMRKLVGKVSHSGCVLVFINQIREKIGVMYGSPETTPGGRALKFYSSCRVDIRRVKALGDDNAKSGHRARCKVVKNKIAPPLREAEFDILYGIGIDKAGELIDIALAKGLITRSGAFYRLGDEVIGQGRERARAAVMDDDALRDTLIDLIERDAEKQSG
jgi:recombination protein RecA